MDEFHTIAFGKGTYHYQIGMSRVILSNANKPAFCLVPFVKTLGTLWLKFPDSFTFWGFKFDELGYLMMT